MSAPSLLVALSLPALAALAGCVANVSEEPVDTDRVEIPGPWVFEPQTIRVRVGATVTFANHGATHHSVTAPAIGLDLDLAPGDSATHAFPEAGEFEYVCKYHPPDMKGKVIVVPADGK